MGFANLINAFSGKPIHGTSIDGIVALAFLAYLVGMVWKTGRTLGARIVRVRVVDTAEPDASGVPLRKAIIRYLAMVIGTVPAWPASPRAGQAWLGEAIAIKDPTAAVFRRYMLRPVGEPYDSTVAYIEAHYLVD